MKEIYRKVYVEVLLRANKEGVNLPLAITWEDGKVYEVDRVKYIDKAAALKAGGCGLRYTVMVCGKETYLFQEGSRWFVEAKQYIQ